MCSGSNKQQYNYECVIEKYNINRPSNVRNEEDDRRKGNVLVKTVIVGDSMIKYLEPAKFRHARA